MNYEQAIETVRIAMLRDRKEWDVVDYEPPLSVAASRMIEVLQIAQSMTMPEPSDTDVDAMGGFFVEWGDEMPFLDLIVRNDGSVIFVRDGAEVTAERVTDLRAVLEVIRKGIDER